MFQLYIHENLVRIHLLFTRYCADKKVSRLRQWNLHKKKYVPLFLGGDIIITEGH